MIKIRELSEKDWLELSIQSISAISENSLKPTIIFRYLNGTEEHIKLP